MEVSRPDPAGELVLDGNSVAGLLQDVFGKEMTAEESRCAACGQIRPVGALLVYGGTAGGVLRCPNCEAVMIRVASRPDGLWLDMQGVAFLRQGSV